MKKANILLGSICVVLGMIFLIEKAFNLQILTSELIMPVSVLFLGLVFEYSYFIRRKNPGLLLPGGILITISLVLFLESFTSREFSQYIWPMYIFSLAVGFYQLYLYSDKKKSILTLAIIFAILTIICYLNIFIKDLFIWLNYNTILAIGLIFIGIFIMFDSKKKD